LEAGAELVETTVAIANQTDAAVPSTFPRARENKQKQKQKKKNPNKKN